MPSVRLWALESDNDAKAVKHLADKLILHLRLKHLSIRWVGKKAFGPVNRKNRSGNDGLKAAVENYLKEDASVIFVIDKDSARSTHKRRQEPNSLINQIERVTKDKSLRGRVFLAFAVQELEAWLLVDCLGISCYFASKGATYREGCRDRLSRDTSVGSLIRKRQRGDTELIVEAESGGKGPKEYLKDFSKEVLQGLNPRMSDRDAGKGQYREKMSPEIAEFIVIDGESLKRNRSLRRLGHLLEKVA